MIRILAVVTILVRVVPMVLLGERLMVVFVKIVTLQPIRSAVVRAMVVAQVVEMVRVQAPITTNLTVVMAIISRAVIPA